MVLNSPPPLFLAPMEGVGDRPFRKAAATIGGFDFACTEFIRVPSNAHVVSLAKVYNPLDTYPIPQAAQIMGSEPETMAQMAQELEKRGAPRIDLNCGCPSNTVTGRGAGSSLLKDPNLLHNVAKAIAQAVNIPVSAKLRTGFLDTSLFEENLLAAEESGIDFLTLHARTKEDGYKAPANWLYIAKAKEILKIPVIGNGDVSSVDDAVNMLRETGCDGIMIGRKAACNPFIFHEIKNHFSKKPNNFSFSQLEKFLRTFYQELDPATSEKTKINKLKQILGFMFQKNEKLQEKRQEMLTQKYDSGLSMLEKNLAILIDIYF
jgi:tRNA-dihydrouridine synthase C